MKFSKGQSLIEVVVAVGAMSLLLVALLTTVSLSVKNSRVAKDRNQAVALAQEGVELMRTYRDVSYTNFEALADTTSYDLPYNWTVGDGLSTGCQVDSFSIRDFYRRCVVLDDSGIVDGVEVEVTVEWQEGSKVNQVVQTTRMSKWER